MKNVYKITKVDAVNTHDKTVYVQGRRDLVDWLQDSKESIEKIEQIPAWIDMRCCRANMRRYFNRFTTNHTATDVTKLYLKWLGKRG